MNTPQQELAQKSQELDKAYREYEDISHVDYGTDAEYRTAFREIAQRVKDLEEDVRILREIVTQHKRADSLWESYKNRAEML